MNWRVNPTRVSTNVQTHGKSFNWYQGTEQLCRHKLTSKTDVKYVQFVFKVLGLKDWRLYRHNFCFLLGRWIYRLWTYWDFLSDQRWEYISGEYIQNTHWVEHVAIFYLLTMTVNNMKFIFSSKQNSILQKTLDSCFSNTLVFLKVFKCCVIKMFYIFKVHRQ